MLTVTRRSAIAAALAFAATLRAAASGKSMPTTPDALVPGSWRRSYLSRYREPMLQAIRDWTDFAGLNYSTYPVVDGRLATISGVAPSIPADGRVVGYAMCWRIVKLTINDDLTFSRTGKWTWHEGPMVLVSGDRFDVFAEHRRFKPVSHVPAGWYWDGPHSDFYGTHCKVYFL